MRRARRFLVSSVVRHAGAASTSGFLYQVSLDGTAPARRCAVSESALRQVDPNPRGGLRGLRGVAALDDRLVVANAERLMVFDRSWQTLTELSHPLLGGIHDVLPDPEGIWATSTSADLLVRLDWEGRLVDSWEWRQDTALTRAFGFGRLPAVDRGRDYRDPRSARHGVPNMAHLNGLGRDPEDGALLVSLGRVLSPARYRRQRLLGLAGRIASALGLPLRRRKTGRHHPAGAPLADHHPGSGSAIVRLTDSGATMRRCELLCRAHGIVVPNHNALRLGPWLLYNDSNSSRLVAVPLATESERLEIEIPGDPSFVRGLAALGPREVLVGNQSPLALYRVDLGEQRVTERILLGGEPGESIYGLAELPETFDDLPSRLPRQRIAITMP